MTVRLQARFFQNKHHDLSNADLLVVMGTSLTVHPFASLVDDAPAECPRLLINREVVGEIPSPMRELGYHSGLWFGALDACLEHTMQLLHSCFVKGLPGVCAHSMLVILCTLHAGVRHASGQVFSLI